MALVSPLRGFPVLEEALRTSPGPAAPFGDCHVLAVQHVHTSMVPLVEALRLGGAEVGRITVVGKSYSTRPRAVAALREGGVTVVDPGRMEDPGRSYEVELEQQVTTVLADLRTRTARSGTTLLVLDEGAVAGKVLTRMPALAARARVVEQTTRGARWLETAHVPFPVVDVARSAAKATLEGPLVARCMAVGLRRILGETSRTAHRVGIVGYGRMGARLAGELAGEAEILVSDTDAAQLRRARADGYRVCPRDELLPAVDVLVGCTGGPILDERALAGRTAPLLLVNGASSDIEFALWHTRRPEAIVSGADAATPWTNHYAVDPARRVILAAGGFPSNFYGTGEPLTARQFQLTRALMLAGAIQAGRLTAPGLTPLDSAVQVALSASYASAMSRPPGTS